MRTPLTVMLALALAALNAPAVHAGCRDDIGPAHLVGAGEFCILGFCLYDAQLWAARPPVTMDQPFALELTYQRSVKGERLVSTGMHEIERLAPEPLPAAQRAAWQADMTRAFTDVAPGDVLCGVFLPGRGARFYTNGRMTAAVDDPAFAQAFFGIWLDPRTRGKTLRAHLLGDAS